MRAAPFLKTENACSAILKNRKCVHHHSSNRISQKMRQADLGLMILNKIPSLLGNTDKDFQEEAILAGDSIKFYLFSAALTLASQRRPCVICDRRPGLDCPRTSPALILLRKTLGGRFTPGCQRFWPPLCQHSICSANDLWDCLFDQETHWHSDRL